MGDKPKSPITGLQSVGQNRSLVRIAETLGVPVSSFYETESFGSPTGGPADRGEAAVLTIVQAYLESVGPEARERFLMTVRNMAVGASR